MIIPSCFFLWRIALQLSTCLSSRFSSLIDLTSSSHLFSGPLFPVKSISFATLTFQPLRTAHYKASSINSFLIQVNIHASPTPTPPRLIFQQLSRWKDADSNVSITPQPSLTQEVNLEIGPTLFLSDDGQSRWCTRCSFSCSNLLRHLIARGDPVRSCRWNSNCRTSGPYSWWSAII